MTAGNRTGLLLFAGVFGAILIARIIQLASLPAAFATAVLDIPVSVIFGRVGLFICEGIVGFIQGLRGKSAVKGFGLSFWHLIALSLTIGFPIWLVVSQGPR